MDRDTCKCCEQDESGNWLYDPCCNIGGIYTADTDDENETLSMCMHCGGQMFKENGYWFHHEQEDIPYEDRIPHYGV